MYDDKTVKVIRVLKIHLTLKAYTGFHVYHPFDVLTYLQVIGSWSDVLSMCKKGHLQPQLLLYEKQR